MTQMGHGALPSTGANTQRVGARLGRVEPYAMTMGQTGMGEMSAMGMPIPPNSISMRASPGPFSPIDMGGMFTVIKVRDRVSSADAKTWYAHPPGQVASKASSTAMQKDGIDPTRT